MSVYCVSDLHGNYAGYEAIKNYIKPEDTVYCLGDCGDRGYAPWQTIVAVYNDPQFIYIKGNHEDMLVRAMVEWLPDHIKGVDYELLRMNGGHKTFRDWKNGPERNKWVGRLNNLPTRLVYENSKGQSVILTHAGYTPPIIPDEQELMWNREHFEEKWTGMDNEIIVHGHTPTSYLTWPSYSSYTYCNNHKIDIDVLTWRTNKVALLDLDTFETIYLYVAEEEYGED